MQLISFCNSYILPVSSKIVSWSSTNLRLAIVSKVELSNFFNSSISLRLLWWASRNSEFCCNNRSWRSCWSRRWSSSAWAQWSSSCWDSIISPNFRTLLLSSSAWNSWFWIVAWHSARICSFCLSNRVLICAIATFSSWPSGPTGRPVLSSTGLSVRSDTDDDDWPTDKPSRWERQTCTRCASRSISSSAVSSYSTSSRNPFLGELWRGSGTLCRTRRKSPWGRRSWAHNLWGGRSRQDCCFLLLSLSVVFLAGANPKTWKPNKTLKPNTPLQKLSF